MKKHCFCMLVAFLLAYLVVSPEPLQGAPLKKIRASFTAYAYANPPFWIAKDLGFFEKYGLDVELVHVSGEKGISAMVGGSLDLVQIGGIAVIAAAAQGMDVVILGTVFDRLVFALHAAEQIKDVKDLKGKMIVTGSIGGNSYFAGLVFISKMGWVLNKDVSLRAVGGSQEVLAALQQGQFQAGIMAPPTTHIATKMGFREIFNIGDLDLPFPTISVASTRKFVRDNPDVMLNVLRATSEATYTYKTRPDLANPVIAKYMRVPKDEPELMQSHALYGKYMNETLAAPLEGIKLILGQLAETQKRPELKSRNPADFVDNRFLQQLESEGFFKKLSQKK